MGARVRHPLVVCEAEPDHGAAVAEELATFGYDVRCCENEESLLETVTMQHPSAVVYELHHQLPVDLAILALIRRVLPGVPLVLIAGQRAEPSERALRAMQPAVIAHEPVNRDGLRAALRRAMRRAQARVRRELAMA